jgi:hypothetical protein
MVYLPHASLGLAESVEHAVGMMCLLSGWDLSMCWDGNPDVPEMEEHVKLATEKALVHMKLAAGHKEQLTQGLPLAKAQDTEEPQPRERKPQKQTLLRPLPLGDQKLMLSPPQKPESATCTRRA